MSISKKLDSIVPVTEAPINLPLATIKWLKVVNKKVHKAYLDIHKEVNSIKSNKFITVMYNDSPDMQKLDKRLSENIKNFDMAITDLEWVIDEISKLARDYYNTGGRF